MLFKIFFIKKKKVSITIINHEKADWKKVNEKKKIKTKDINKNILVKLEYIQV